MSIPRNKKILDEVNRAGGWRHAVKKRPVWARPITRNTRVETLEGMMQARRGDFLCRGEAGEVWPQSKSRMLRQYVATPVVDSQGWRMYMPSRTARGVLAAKLPHACSVQSERGTFAGKVGDFLLKSYDDKEVEYPEKLWVVDKRLFAQTYRVLDSP